MCGQLTKIHDNTAIGLAPCSERNMPRNDLAENDNSLPFSTPVKSALQVIDHNGLGDGDQPGTVRRVLFNAMTRILFPVAAVCIGWTSFQAITSTTRSTHLSRLPSLLSSLRNILPSIPVMFATLLATPALAILQGTIEICKFRLFYGDAPAPVTPSHGVVVAIPTVRNMSDNSLYNSSAPESTTPPASTSLDDIVREPPVRLLVIGDSLANGIGQSQSCTPVMPEAIAKSLSRNLGRVVYWTCHGSPGASTAKIVRELDQGFDFFEEQQSPLDEDEEHDHEKVSQNGTDMDESDAEKVVHMKGPINSSCSETEESSSDDSSTAGRRSRPLSSLTANGESEIDTTTTTTTNAAACLSTELKINKNKNSSTTPMSVWKRRLAQHRKRFNPDLLGPYDIIVVLIGSNDLKSAFFPFMLSGDEVEFRRQAKQRGGNYAEELRLLMETLNRKMRLQFESFRHSVIETVEAATDTVRGKVEETMERIAPGSSNRMQLFRHTSRGQQQSPLSVSKASSGRSLDHHELLDGGGHARHAPLVVLPGLPSRALPIFRNAPLRWFVGPIVDVMDAHKRKLAKAHPGEVLFVKAPTTVDMTTFERQEGVVWQEKAQEETVLSLRDIKKSECRRLEQDMRGYLESKMGTTEAKAGNSSFFFNAFSRMLLVFANRNQSPAPLSTIFAVDRVHPTDVGYDFWGRYIAQYIFDEWVKQHPPTTSQQIQDTAKRHIEQEELDRSPAIPSGQPFSKVANV